MWFVDAEPVPELKLAMRSALMLTVTQTTDGQWERILGVEANSVSYSTPCIYADLRQCYILRVPAAP